MRRLLWSLPAVLLVASATTAGAAGSSSPVSGVDLARYQHPGGAAIDWRQVKSSGRSFAIVKATEGRSYTNPYFARDYAGAHSAGLVRGAYSYARPALPVSSADKDADTFVRVAGAADHKGDLPLVLDLEESGGLSPAQLTSWTSRFLKRLTARTGRTPIVYTYPYFWQTAMRGSRAFTGYPLWIADYRSAKGPRTPLPGGWKSWTFWQNSARGHVRGIPATVDVDRFHGSRAALDRLATPPAKASPGPGNGPRLPALPGLPTLPKLPGLSRLPLLGG